MTNKQQSQKLQMVITALGADKPGLVSELSHTIMECGCDIEDSRMIALGGEFAVILQVSGSWNAVAKLESSRNSIERQLNMTLACKRSGGRPPNKTLLRYSAEVVAMDHPGIVYNLAKFFSDQGINIEELVTNSYAAAHTGTPMFAVHMQIDIPSSITIALLRDQFMDFCDELNLDAVLEPNRLRHKNIGNPI